MIRVTIEQIDEDGFVEKSSMRTGEDGTLGFIVAYAMIGFDLCREDEEAANIALTLLSEIDNWQFFDGHAKAIDAMQTAAKTIRDGWEKYDEGGTRNENPTRP